MKSLIPLTLLCGLSLMACEETPSVKQTSVSSFATRAVTVSGIVADREGLFAEATVIAQTLEGATITATQADAQGEYQLVLPKGTHFPVLLRSEGRDGKPIEAVILNEEVPQQDLTRMSTLVVASARNLGGITPENMVRAAANAIQQSRTTSGKQTVAGFKGDPTKQYGGWH